VCESTFLKNSLSLGLKELNKGLTAKSITNVPLAYLLWITLRKRWNTFYSKILCRMWREVNA